MMTLTNFKKIFRKIGQDFLLKFPSKNISNRILSFLWILRRTSKNLAPEFIAISVMLWMGIEPCKEYSYLWILFLLNAIFLRFIWNAVLAIHGLGHVLVIAVADQKYSYFSISNILENRNISTIFKSLFPLCPIFIPVFNTSDCPWIVAGYSAPWAIRIKAAGGLALNLIAMEAAFLFFNSPLHIFLSDFGVSYEIQFLLNIFIASNGLLVLSSLSDIAAFVSGSAECFNCGNFGFVGKRTLASEKDLLPQKIVEVFKIMGRETEIRGEQAGGGLVLARNPQNQTVFVGKKVVNQKRDNLTRSLETAFASVRHRAVAKGIKPLESTTVGAWHYRYGTSGPPDILETHWHEWMPARCENVWSIKAGKWSCLSKNVNHRITHNGDFDAWTLYGKPIENAHLGLWLERVLHAPNLAKGDSPKIAGMMDLLIAQGIWFAAVRLAYQLAVATSIEAAFGGVPISIAAPHTAPSAAELSRWADTFEHIFMLLYGEASNATDAIAEKERLSHFERTVLQKLSQDLSIREWSHRQRISFVKTAIQAFFHNDLFHATQQFMANAKGSFGLVTVSTLEPEQLVLSALGQPIIIGFNPQEDYTIYASEPAAIDAVLENKTGSFRLDLNQTIGEVALVSAESLTLYSMEQERNLRPAEIVTRWISMESNASLQPILVEPSDPVERDIKEIPQVLQNIEQSWAEPFSMNCQSAEHLVYFLIEKAEYFRQKQIKILETGLDTQIGEGHSVDLLITGVENSLWLGEQFAQDAKTIFPFLHIKALSSNQVLKALKHDMASLQLGKRTLVLAITQSGQTFSTVQAIHAFEQLRHHEGICELFIVTGEPRSFLDSTKATDTPTHNAQPVRQNRALSHRMFVNRSGRRTAEPSTLASAATHQTLTELLLYIAQHMREAFPNGRPFGMTLTSNSLLFLKRINSDFLEKSVYEIIGNTETGKPIESAIHQQLIANGQKWALHVTETPIVWGIHALYTLISVGWVIPFGYTIPIVTTLFHLILMAFGLTSDFWFAALISPVLTVIDIAIYIFGPWLWTIALRYVQGRPLLARTGKRTLVIGDTDWVHQLLNAYVSKLFSLSYGIASLEVQSANPQDHLLHHFGHQVARGTLIFLGVPDGRWSEKLNIEENAVIMTGKQAHGVRNRQIGSEVIVLGHNPDIKNKGFNEALVLRGDPSSLYLKQASTPEQQVLLEALNESRFKSFGRLLASYVFFWALAKKVALFPFLKYEHWKSQSRTKIMTTASPVSGLDMKQFEKEMVQSEPAHLPLSPSGKDNKTDESSESIHPRDESTVIQ
jgi:hypothetical protein